MNSDILFAITIAASLAGCGGREVDQPTTPTPEVREVSRSTPSRPSSYGYAESPITELATAVTEIALAALREEPLPEGVIAIEEPHPDQPLVRIRSDAELNLEELEVLGIGLELEIMLGAHEEEGEAPPEPTEQEATLKTAVFLTSHGLCVVGLQVRSPRLGRPLPSDQPGIAELAEDILERLRNDSLQAIFIGEPQRAAIGSDRVWGELTEGLPRPAELARAASFARANERPRGFGFDDLAILIRDGSGNLFAVVLDLEHGSDGSLELDSRPLIRVQPVD